MTRVYKQKPASFKKPVPKFTQKRHAHCPDETLTTTFIGAYTPSNANANVYC
jgi:hypothetical protein